MAEGPARPFEVLTRTLEEFVNDNCFRMAAALSYYTVFSLPPLLVMVVQIAGAVWGEQAVRGELSRQMSSWIGPAAAEQTQTMIRAARSGGSGAGITTLLGIGTLVFGATGAFAQLQYTLNEAWQVAPDPERSSIRTFLVKRLLSFGMVLASAFLLLVAAAATTLVAAIGDRAAALVPSAVAAYALPVAHFVVFGFILTLVFAAIFTILPDAEVAWRDVWIGAMATALLFVLGNYLVGFYLARSETLSFYGAAASLALLLLWIYFASLILFLGAEFTQVWARRFGRRIRPSAGAVAVVRERKPVRGSEPVSS